jgi:acetyl esterase/lipase
MGAVLVAGSYRLAPRCRWPAQFEDVRDALRFVGRSAESFGGDAQRIVIGGHSAGGHLASLVALKQERPSLVGCVPVSSSFDLQYGDVPIESDAGRVYRYLFSDRQQDREASPINFVSQAAPPFHIFWGERDFERVRKSSEHMAAALRVNDIAVSHRILHGGSHFDTHLALSNAADPWYERLRDLFAPSPGIDVDMDRKQRE